MNVKLTYAPDPSSKELFSVFTDADYGGDLDTGRSTGAQGWNWSRRLEQQVATHCDSE